MARRTELPSQATENAADAAGTHLPTELPAVQTPPEHELPPTSAALPEEALPLPEQTVEHMPSWLLPA